MKKILYLTFFYEPDLSACAFRNTSLVNSLIEETTGKEIQIDLYTTMPNRYSTYKKEVDNIEYNNNCKITRIEIPAHKSGFIDQIFAFKKYYYDVKKCTYNNKYDLVFVSTGRFFSSYLGYKIAKKNKIPLYIDVRDIFVDTLNDVIKNKIIKTVLIPFLKHLENKVFKYACHINLISEGFKPYFNKYDKTNYTFYTNGIDKNFLNINIDKVSPTKNNSNKIILYAGNIGEGQGLHKIIPSAAKMLEDNFNFIIIGDGGAKNKLINKINELENSNIEIRNPISRSELIKEYLNADFLFLHLNDYNAFEKVLPSKIFEYSVFNKPIIAGVKGFSRKFINDNLNNSIIFDPCNATELYHKISDYKIEENINRNEFILEYSRENINKRMALSILEYIF